MKFLTEEIHGEKVCLMGHSMGAKIIMETLCEHKDVLLEKVAGTIVIDMPPHAASF
jgi:alpha-beta hydrolase superfamily lysophospholipase